MNSFDNAFQLGIAAARSVEQRKEEITSILGKFSQSLSSQTNGRLGVEIRQGTGFSEFINGFTTSAVLKPLGLYVVDTKDKNTSVQIAGWKQSEDGYPCWITTHGEEVACTDGAGLENELMRLAQSPKLGAAVLELCANPADGRV